MFHAEYRFSFLGDHLKRTDQTVSESKGNILKTLLTSA